MKNLTKTILGAATLMGLFGTGAAVAQDAPNWALTGFVAATSDYRFRGISQNDRSFAPQGSLNVTGPDGWYVGTWASQVDFDPASSGNPHMELDIYGGKHTDLWGYADLNVEAYYYSYPAADVPSGTPAPDYFEGIAQLSRTFDRLALTATWAYSPNLAFDGGTGNYLGGTASFTLLDWLSVSGNIGHQWAQNAKYAGSSDYTHGDIGLTATYKGFSLDGRYAGTDLSGAKCAAFYMATTHACAGGFVATLSYNFALMP